MAEIQNTREFNSALEELLEKHRNRNARGVLWFQAGASGVWVLLVIWDYFVSRTGIYAGFPVIFLFFAINAGLLFISRRFKNHVQRAVIGVPLLDIAVIFYAQYGQVTQSPTIELRWAAAAFSSSAFALPILLSILSLRKWQVFWTGLGAVVLNSVLLVLVGFPASGPGSVIVVVGSFTALAYMNVLLIERLFGQVVETQVALTTVEIEKKELEKDLELTGAVQNLLLPKRGQINNGHLEFSSFFKPSAKAGGDWWWFEELPNGALLFLVGDVTGHGAASAMVSATVASSFWTQRSRPSIVGDSLKQIPAELELLGSQLLQHCDGSYLMTLTAGYFDPRSAKVSVWSAGGPPVFLLRANGEIESISGAGTPLGAAEVKIPVQETAVSRADRVILFTDGVFEGSDSDTRPLGLKGMTRVLAETRALDHAQAFQSIAKSIQDIQTRPKDDMTFVLVDVLQ